MKELNLYKKQKQYNKIKKYQTIVSCISLIFIIYILLSNFYIKPYYLEPLKKEFNNYKLKSKIIKTGEYKTVTEPTKNGIISSVVKSKDYSVKKIIDPESKKQKNKLKQKYEQAQKKFAIASFTVLVIITLIGIPVILKQRKISKNIEPIEYKSNVPDFNFILICDKKNKEIILKTKANQYKEKIIKHNLFNRIKTFHYILDDSKKIKLSVKLPVSLPGNKTNIFLGVWKIEIIYNDNKVINLIC